MMIFIFVYASFFQDELTTSYLSEYLSWNKKYSFGEITFYILQICAVAEMVLQ